MSDAGSSVSRPASSASSRSLVRYGTVSRPGMSGIVGRLPVARRTRSPMTCRSPTRTVCGSANIASRSISSRSVRPSATLAYFFARYSRTTPSFWAMSAAKSTGMSVGARPAYRGWDASWTILAASMRFLDGRQPRFAHVPPSIRRSTIATRAPSSDALIAAANAVDPDPRIRRSNGSAIRGGATAALERVVLAGRPDGGGERGGGHVGARFDDRAARLEIDGGGHGGARFDDRAARLEIDGGALDAGHRLERLGDVDGSRSTASRGSGGVAS